MVNNLDSELENCSAVKLRKLLLAREITSAEVVQHCLAQVAKYNQQVGAFVTITESQALDRATAIDKLGVESAILAGIPHGDKDLATRNGVNTFFGSAAAAHIIEQDNFSLPAGNYPDSPIVKLADGLGLVSLGKTNTPEFGLFGYTESDIFSPARHPENLQFNAGGSSGGAAVAVKSGMLPFAIGSDGGGSIRIPAATVGIVGLKPTLGSVSVDRENMSPTGVVNGPLARDAQDAALLYEAMVGLPVGSTFSRQPRRLKIAFAIDSPWQPEYDLEPASMSLKALEVGVNRLIGFGHKVVGEISLKDKEYGHIFRTAWYRSARELPDWVVKSFLQPLTLALHERGAALSSDEVMRNIDEINKYRHRAAPDWNKFDLLVTPALGLPPQPVGTYSEDPDENFSQQVAYSPYTSWINMLGLPACVVPIGRFSHGDTEIPFGVQLVGPHGADQLLLQVASEIQMRV